jgi:hypothetical protein
MSVDFATPIAHQTGGNYNAFNNALVLGRPFRQPLQTAPSPNNFSRGTEIFFPSAGVVADIFAWFDGTLEFEAGTLAEPGDRLVLTTDPLVLFNSDRGVRTLASLHTLEAKPRRAIYENVDLAAVKLSLQSVLLHAYIDAGANPHSPDNWHPSMRMQVLGAGVQFKEYLDLSPPAIATIDVLLNDFLSAAPTLMNLTMVRVRAGDQLGRAAGYPAGDQLPQNAPFPLGAAGDPNRARRLTFVTEDQGKQTLNPAYYFNIFMRQMLAPSANRIVQSLTNIVDAGALRHPLVSLLPAINNAAAPVARERVGGQYKFPIGHLNALHGFPLDGPQSLLEWCYDDAGVFEAQARVAGSAVPPLAAPAGGAAANKATSFWNAYGVQVNGICERLQVPVELVMGLIGAEAPPNLDQRVVRLEPLRYGRPGLPLEREKIAADPAVTAVDELNYDHTVGLALNITAVARLGNGTTRLTVTLGENRLYKENLLGRGKGRRYWYVLVEDADRLAIVANNSESDIATTNYTITVEDAKFLGGMAAAGTQAGGITNFYHVHQRGAGAGAIADAQTRLLRAGTLRRLRVQAAANTLGGVITITVMRNGEETDLLAVLADGATQSNDNVTEVATLLNDEISIRVLSPAGAGSLRGLQVDLYHSPTLGAGYLLEGYTPPGVPNPWNDGNEVRVGRGLRWDRLVAIITATNGERISPGLLQTLISTARETLPFLNAVDPTFFASLGIPNPPGTAGDFLNDWLLTGAHSVALGVAVLRKQASSRFPTFFDLPLVGAAYNTGQLDQINNNRWGLRYFGDYVETGGPVFNGGVNLFDGAAPPPVVPITRFML